MGVTDEGLDHLLNTQFNSAVPVYPWYVGLISGVGTPATGPADTAARHPGWVEVDLNPNSYATDAHRRKGWGTPPATQRQIGTTYPLTWTNLAGDGVPLYGLLLASEARVGTTSGTLCATLAFAAGVRHSDYLDTVSLHLTLAASGS